MNKNIINSPLCKCGAVESNYHYLFQCPDYSDLRATLLNTISPQINISLRVVLYGDDNLSDDINKTIIDAVQQFIIATRRFDNDYITEKIVSALWVMCVLATCSGEALGGCQYQLSQCYGQMRGMEQRLNLMETQQNRMVGRQSAVTQAVTRGISNLDQDTKTVKSVLNTLVKENVNMHGDISLLKGYGDDIVGLRRQVNGVKQTMWGQLTDVRGKIDDVSQHLGQNANAQTKVTVLMSTQMERNKQLLQGIQAQSSGLESKMKKVEKQMSSSNVHGMMDELTGRIDSLQNDYDQQLKELTNKLKNFKK